MAIIRSDSWLKFDQPPICNGLLELPSASEERARLNDLFSASTSDINDLELSPLMRHLAFGLAYTTGSAVGELPPSRDDCLDAFIAPNAVGLTAGARAWAKHSHRSEQSVEANATGTYIAGWWGHPKGPMDTINKKALELFWRVMDYTSWRNLHWLPHQILVYEVRVKEGYGMRWSQDRSVGIDDPPWTFRGFLEPMMENGHDLGWRH